MIIGAILSGGIGNRINCGFPKQFLEINGKPILVHSIEKFLAVEDFDKIIVSSPKEYINETKNLVERYFGKNELLVVIEGGKQRHDTIINSIYCAIEMGADKHSIMVTHDAARIFVTSDLIKESIFYSKKYGAASAVIPTVDVIFKSNDGKSLNEVPLRKNLLRAQTPQSFNIYKYLSIYIDLSNEEKEKLDEAMVLFNLRDEEVHLFEGSQINFKITKPLDVIIAESIFKHTSL